MGLTLFKQFVLSKRTGRFYIIIYLFKTDCYTTGLTFSCYFSRRDLSLCAHHLMRNYLSILLSICRFLMALPCSALRPGIIVSALCTSVKPIANQFIAHRYGLKGSPGRNIQYFGESGIRFSLFEWVGLTDHL